MNIIDSSMNLLMILSPSLPSQVTVECPSRRASTLAGRDLLLWTRMKSAQRCARPGRRGSSTAGLLLPGQSLCRSHGALVRRRVQTDVPASGGGIARETYPRLPRAAISSPGHMDPAICSGPLRRAAHSGPARYPPFSAGHVAATRRYTMAALKASWS